MKLLSIILDGFGSYPNRVIVRLDNPGITLLSGLNGSGKSTIGRAIVWALTGKTIEGIAKSNVTYLYSTAQSCRVDLFYSFGKTTAQVSRLRESGKSGERLEYYPDGKRFEGATVKETQERIFSDMGIPENLFGSLFLLSRINAQEFMLSDSNRKKWIEQLFDADFSEYYKKVGSEFSRASAEISTKREDFSRIQYEISGRERTIKDLEEERERQVKTNQEDRELRIEDLKERLQHLLEDIQNLTYLQASNADEMKEKSECVSLLQEAERKFSDLQRAVGKVSPITDACLSCPTYQNSKTLQDTLQKKLASDKITLDSLRREKDFYLGLDRDVQVIKSKIDILLAQKEQLIQSIDSLRKQKPKDETKGFDEKIVSIGKEIESLSKEGFEISFDIAFLSERITVLEFWRNAFGNKGIKNFLMDMLRPKLQAYSNVVLQKISPELSIGFPTSTILKSGEMKETDFPVLIFLSGQEIEYKSLSVGQQGRIDFALLFGRRKLLESWKGASVEFLFLDDFFGSCDSVFIDRALSLVREENVPAFVAHPETEGGVPDDLIEKVNRVIKVSLINHSTILKEEK